ncbi:SNF2-related protein [Leifsonia sp. NPDC102414]|uniref:SNF2-related protein n=1 Tax=Leifsonia sp. NPDC102414 TaxID=3364124 RepID=UPI0037F10C94
MPDTPTPAGWKAQVSGLTRPAASAASLAAAPARAAALGLQFELRERTRASTGRWDAPTSRTATAAAVANAGKGARGMLRLGVRPVMRSGTGNWVRGSLTWSALPHLLNRLSLDPAQHAWFGQFAALHRAGRDVYVPGEADWLSIDEFASPLLWPLLEEGERLGIALVTGKRETDVDVADGASVAVDADTLPDGGLRLRTVAIVGETAHPGSAAGAIADHGIYLWSLDPAPRFTLARTAKPLSAEQRRLLAADDTIEVPADETDEFLRSYYPRLQGVVEVVSTDASVEFSEILPPVLVLTATFAGNDRLELDWAWLSAIGEEPVDAHPVPSGLVDALGWRPHAAELTGLDAAEFSATLLPALERRKDVRVDIVGDRPDYRELVDTPKLVVTTVETDKRDWFDLGVLVTVEGRTIPFTPLFKALSQGRPKLLLVDKSYLSLQQPVFDRLRALIDEAKSLDEWEPGSLRISRYQASLWSEFVELADEAHQAESWRRTAEGLRAIRDGESPDDVAVPASVAATLRPYQVDGFRWLAFLWEHGLGGVLADDMGLGKTLQTLALIAHARGREPGGPPFLVVAPTSVVSNWVAEAARFTPELSVRAVTATQAKSRRPLRTIADGADVVVTSYALFRLDIARYQAVGWAGLILDEAQLIKNRTSKAHEAARDLRVPFKLAITGTPMENDLFDVWSIFRVVSPGLLPPRSSFTDRYLKPLAAGDRPDLLVRLRQRVRPLMLRRTKEAVASELPPKQEQVLRVELAPKHRRLYDLVLQRERQKILGLVDDLDRNRFIVFRSLTLLRMLALDATLVDAQYAGIPSAKIDVLLDELADVVAGGHRALIFSQFTSLLRTVAVRLDERGIGYAYLDGSTRRRDEVIDGFRDGDAPAFLISLKAGGFGLNLTEADYVFLLDPWWNPATESQAIDRTHRIGQQKNVMVYRMIADDTIEDKVMALKERKARLFEALMDDPGGAFDGTLSADDIRGLLDS